MRKLYPYQNRACWAVYRYSHIALYAGLGSGKTAVILHVLHKHLNELNINKVLLVGPIAVVKSVWEQEAKKWDRTKDLVFSYVLGNPAQRLKALKKDADIYLINYENISWLINLPHIDDFDALVLDESSMVQSWSSIRFKGKGKHRHPKTHKIVPARKGLKHIVGKFNYVYEISGTPKSGEYLGLWSQMYCLDQGAALEKTITAFKGRYYFQYGPEPYMIKIRGPKEEEEIKRRIKPLVYRISPAEVRSVLPTVVELTHTLELPAKARKVYNDIESDFFAEFESGEEVTVDNVAVRSNKLQQVCQGAIYTDDNGIELIHDAKLKRLEALVDDLGDRNCLILYAFKSDLLRLQTWRNAPVLRSSMAKGPFNALCDKWNSGSLPMIYGHPKSMSHGINLQGGGFDVIFYGLSWSLDRYLQVIGRLARSGQAADTVFAHRIAVINTIETELMLPRLIERDGSQRAFLDAFDAYRRARSAR